MVEPGGRAEGGTGGGEAWARTKGKDIGEKVEEELGWGQSCEEETEVGKGVGVGGGGGTER